jgi:hypothetical protein
MCDESPSNLATSACAEPAAEGDSEAVAAGVGTAEPPPIDSQLAIHMLDAITRGCPDLIRGALAAGFDTRWEIGPLFGQGATNALQTAIRWRSVECARELAAASDLERRSSEGNAAWHEAVVAGPAFVQLLLDNAEPSAQIASEALWLMAAMVPGSGAERVETTRLLAPFCDPFAKLEKQDGGLARGGEDDEAGHFWGIFWTRASEVDGAGAVFEIIVQRMIQVDPSRAAKAARRMARQAAEAPPQDGWPKRTDGVETERSRVVCRLADAGLLSPDRVRRVAIVRRGRGLPVAPELAARAERHAIAKAVGEALGAKTANKGEACALASPRL